MNKVEILSETYVGYFLTVVITTIIILGVYRIFDRRLRKKTTVEYPSESGEYKQVILIRKDLKMGRGKEIAQGAHASMAFLTSIIRDGKRIPDDAHRWILSSFIKIVLQVPSEDVFDEVVKNARKRGVLTYVITDSGRTVFHGTPTKTAAGLGPARAEDLQEITKDLKLY